MINTNRLKAKGWSDYEIKGALDSLIRAEEKKHPMVKLLDQTLYWVFLVIAIGGNIAFSIAFIPLMIILPTSYLYAIIGFTGFIFGILCTTLLQSIDRIDTRHHIVYMIITPLIGIINYIVIVKQANNIVRAFQIGQEHNTLLLGATYIFFFILPYALFRGGRTEWI